VSPLYMQGPAPVKLPITGKSRPKGGTAHRGEAWTQQVRLLRVLLETTHCQCPQGVQADADAVGLDIIEHLGELDPKAVHVLRTVFATLHRLSH
jgi:hypothetical protein